MVVERIFGIIKKRFRMMRETNEFPMAHQGQIISAVCVLHNFIRIYDPEDLLEEMDEEELLGGGGATDVNRQYRVGDINAAESEEASQRRDEIAQAMWRQYQQYLARR